MITIEREAASSPSEQERHKHEQEFTEKLHDALGRRSIYELYPPEVFKNDTEEDMYMRGDKLARQVADTWRRTEDDTGYAPLPDIMVEGLVNYAVNWSEALEQVYPYEFAPKIQVGMVHFAAQILAKTKAADGTQYASLRDRLLVRRKFQKLREEKILI